MHVVNMTLLCVVIFYCLWQFLELFCLSGRRFVVAFIGVSLGMSCHVGLSLCSAWKLFVLQLYWNKCNRWEVLRHLLFLKLEWRQLFKISEINFILNNLFQNKILLLFIVCNLRATKNIFLILNIHFWELKKNLKFIILHRDRICDFWDNLLIFFIYFLIKVKYKK